MAIPLPTSQKVSQSDPKLYEALQDLSQQAVGPTPYTGPTAGYGRFVNGKFVGTVAPKP